MRLRSGDGNIGDFNAIITEAEGHSTPAWEAAGLIGVQLLVIGREYLGYLLRWALMMSE